MTGILLISILTNFAEQYFFAYSSSMKLSPKQFQRVFISHRCHSELLLDKMSLTRCADIIVTVFKMSSLFFYAKVFNFLQPFTFRRSNEATYIKTELDLTTIYTSNLHSYFYTYIQPGCQTSSIHRFIKIWRLKFNLSQCPPFPWMELYPREFNFPNSFKRAEQSIKTVLLFSLFQWSLFKNTF